MEENKQIPYKYACKECDNNEFLTVFAPLTEKPAYCPCCGSDEDVYFIGDLRPEIDCQVCGGSGFSGYGTGYDAVCDNCAGSGVQLNNAR